MNNIKKPKLLILYAEVMSYTLSTLESIQSQNVDLYVVHWDKKKISSYVINSKKKLKFYNYSKFTTRELISFSIDLDPDLVVISGWNDIKYVMVACFLRRIGKKVVCSMDNQWRGTIKQRFAVLISNRLFLNFFFTHTWIAGIEQYEYARKLGFKNSEIIWDAYCADLKIFNDIKIKRNFDSNKKLVFVGRLEIEKGIDKLLDAWKKISNKNNWELEIIGEGTLSYLIKQDSKDIKYTPFLQPEKLVNKLKESHALILPSIFEPWGVVLQEAVACGLPVIASEKVGSSNKFLINNFNGYKFSFSKNSSNNLVSVLKKLINLSEKDLESFSNASLSLARKIETSSSVANILSVLD